MFALVPLAEKRVCQQLWLRTALLVVVVPSAELCWTWTLVLAVLLCSQNHRMAEAGRDLWRSFCPTPLLKQGHLELVAQDNVRMAFEYLQGGRLFGQSVPVVSNSHSKIVFPDVQMGPSVFQFVLIASGPATGHQ